MINRQRNRYDSFLIWMYSSQREYLIPADIKAEIPHSTASTWRSLDYRELIGHELRHIQEEAVNHYSLMEQHQNLKRTIRVITKVWISISEHVLPYIHKQKELQGKVVNCVQDLFTALPKKIVLRLSGLSPSMFYERLSLVKMKCGISPSQRCFKRHPLQLSLSEVRKIKHLFNEPEMACWPASSLYYFGVRYRELYISLSTFYKYVRILGLKRRFRPPIKKLVGLRSSKPNEYLHVDTTIWELEHGVKAYVVFVTDNFSKAILGYALSLSNTAANVRKALEMAIGTIAEHHPKHACTVLVSDGGSENNAMLIEDLLNETKHPKITKVVALKDISFSNSPVEAINRIFKRYLRHYHPKTESTLNTILDFFVNDYGTIRPHGSIAGLCPMECYSNPDVVLDFREEKRKARSIRMAQNMGVECKICQ